MMTAKKFAERIQAIFQSEKVPWLTLHDLGGDTHYSGTEILDRVQDFCDYFRENEYGEGDIVLIIQRESLDLFASFFAALVMGLRPAFLSYPSSKQSSDAFHKSLEPVLKWHSVRAIITFRSVKLMLDVTLENSSNSPVIVDSISVPSSGPFRSLPRLESEFGFLQFSSGKTGAKKGVLIEYDSLMDQV